MLPTGSPVVSNDAPMGLEPGQWKVNPRTGIISLSEDAFKKLRNKDPIEKWYTIDPESIARGQFTAVHRCIHRVSGEEFAAKFSLKRRLGSDCTADLVHEVAVCALLREAKRVVDLVDVFDTKSELILVMEYAPGGDLQTLLDEDLVPYERNVICFLRQLLDGLVFIHDKNIVHLDIKPQNLVLMGDFPDCCVKLCDFEISRLLTPGYEVREIFGTADYVAPEIIHYEPITTKTDMWSFGVLTYVLLTGFLPFGGENDQETFLEITRGGLDFPEELFEDISEHAIDFIKRLLIRQPHLRMSAKECLEHAWMQADKKMPKMSTQTLYLNSLNSNPSSRASVESNLNTTQQNSLFRQQMINSNKNCPNLSLPPTLHTTPNLNEIELGLSLQRALDILESGTHTSSKATSPKNITPTILTPVHSSPRDTGLPPLHPYMSTRVCPSAHSSSSSLNRGGSRQSLERLRSISKSREILVERLQNSSQRKALSRSRERLFDGRYGLNKSNNGLYEQRSFSHSVETLPPFDWYTNDESIYNSFNSVNVLPIFSMLPMLDENNMNIRQYRSMASIERLNELTNENKNASNKTNFFDSRVPVNNTDYDKIMSCYKSTANGAECQRKTYRRESGSDDKQMKLNNNENERIEGPSFKSSSNVTKFSKVPTSKQNSTTKVKKTEKSKKDPQKRRKEKDKTKKSSIRSGKEETKGKKISKDKETSPSKPTTEKKRGSISHIEQRIQERHERLHEKEETSKLRKRKVTTQNKPSVSSQTPLHSKSRETTSERTSKWREHKPKRHKSSSVVKSKKSSKDDPPSSIEDSPSSSLESIKEFSNNNNINNNYYYNNKKTYKCPSHSSETKILLEDNQKQLEREEGKKCDKKSLPFRSVKTNLQKDFPEFSKTKDKTISSGEPVDEGIFGRSNSVDSTTSTTSIESGSTIKAEDTEILESTLKNLTVMETRKIKDESKFTEINRVTKDTEMKIVNLKSNDSVTLHDQTSNRTISKRKEATVSKMESPANDSEGNYNDPLTIIREEENNAYTARSAFTGSASNVMFSETRNSLNEDLPKLQRRSETPDASTRNRSFSIQNRSSSFFPFKLSRSNSIHLDSPLTGKARPWGEVCDGAVNRACQMFSQKSVEIAFVMRKSSDPTSDRL